MAHDPPHSILGYLRQLVSAPEVRDLNDRQLLERFAARRDAGAFEALVERHGPLVHGVCRRILGNLHDVEDAFQATFLVLARRAGSVGWRSAVGPWLSEVAHRIALKARAGGAKRRRHEARAAARRPSARSMDDMTWRELQQALDEELHTLPAKYRAPLVLCYLQGKTRDEAAQELGWSAGAVKGCLERGRELLRRRLARRGLTLSAALLATMLAQAAAAAAVPAALTAATAQAALAFAAGRSAPNVIAPPVLALARTALRAVLGAKLRLAAAVLLAGVLGVGFAWVAARGPGDPPAAGALLAAGFALNRLSRPPLPEPPRVAEPPAEPAETVRPVPRERAGDEARRTELRGVVRAVDAEDRSISVLVRPATRDGEMREEAVARTFLVAADARITLAVPGAGDSGGSEIAVPLAELSDGLTITFALAADGRTVAAIRVQPPQDRGTVRVVIPDRFTLTLAGEGRDRTLTVARDARVTVDGKPVRLDDLRPGMRVTCWLSADRRTVLALTVSRDRRPAEDN